MKKYILLLATLSGTCGIAYEILYSRMLSTYLGDMFYVAAATLAAFLLSLGIGSLIAQKWPKSLGWIEIAIGIYAIFVSYVFANYGEQVVTTLVNTSLPTPFILMASVFSILIIPAMMIGFSVPLFTLYAHKHSNKEDKDSRFGWVYFSYNIGAAICVLAIEYILLRTFGISQSVQFIALINIIIGLLILKIPAPQKPKNISLKININSKVSALFIASFASGILQLFYLKLTGKIFGPFHENFAVVLTVALLGIALGSAMVTLTKLRFHHILFIAALSTIVIFSSLGEGIYLWAYLNVSYFGPESMSWLLKIIMIFALSILPLTFIGGAIPAFLKDKSIKISAGHALAVSSFGNCAGFLIMLFVLHHSLTDANIALVITLLLMLSAFIFAYKKMFYIAAVGIMISFISIPNMWPEKMMQVSFRELSKPGTINYIMEAMDEATTYKGFDSTVDLVKTKEGRTLYIINGYKSLSIGGTKKSNLREMTFGMSPALFSENHNNALVLGLGTGLTSAGTASVFKHVDVAEINPLVIDMIDIFNNENLNLSKKSHVDIQLQDGLIALMQKEKKYDAIINTVTSPAYFSSAKLYTSDFFKLAARKLNKGGVYSIWFDSRLSKNGVKIIFNSLKSAFKNCRPVHLSRNYHQIICSNDQLTAHKKAKIDQEIADYFKNELYISLPIQEYLSNLILYSHPRFPDKGITETKWDAPLNTFNNPTLEFDISDNLFSRQFNRQKSEFKYTDLIYSAYDGHILTPKELARRCATFNIIASNGDTECLHDAIHDPSSIDLDMYLDLVVNHFMKHDVLIAILSTFDTLIDHSKTRNVEISPKIIPFMCDIKLSTEQRSVHQYSYTKALMSENKQIPLKLISDMRSKDAIQNAQVLANDLIQAFSLPAMHKQLDKTSDPCKFIK